MEMWKSEARRTLFPDRYPSRRLCKAIDISGSKPDEPRVLSR